MKKSEIFFGIIKIPMDFGMTVLAFLAAYKFRIYADTNKLFEKAIDYTVLPSPEEYLNFSIYAALALILIFAINRMYTLKITQTFSKMSGYKQRSFKSITYVGNRTRRIKTF